MNSYRFVCEKENWNASWAAVSKHFYGKTFVPTTLHLAACKKDLAAGLRVELDDVIVYSGDTLVI